MSLWFGKGLSQSSKNDENLTPQRPPSPKKKSLNFRKEAIPLVEVDDEGKFRIGDEAREILSSLTGKICVISVAGLYRTGKSSLVNFLLSEESLGAKGFTVGPTVRRCTRGIWFWGEPRLCQLPSGEACWVILLDTEGLGGLEADQHYDTRIFSLATLLCSTLVYNSLGAIDESAISNLSFVANLSQHIRIHEPSGNSSSDNFSSTTASGGSEIINQSETTQMEEAHEFHNFFPSFVWVVRDFALDLQDEHGNAMSADEYLEKSLRPQVGFDAATTERNRVRSMLTAFFTHRACYPLVRPLNDEIKLQKVNDVPFSDLRSEFIDGVRELKRHLYEINLTPKQIHGRPLSGASFLALAEQYVAAIDSGGVPTISTAWEEVTARECQDAKEAGLYEYQNALLNDELRDYPICTTDKLYRAHLTALKRATAVFRQRAAGESSERFRREMEDEINIIFDKKQRENLTKSNELCHELITKLHETLVAPKLLAPAMNKDDGDLDQITGGGLSEDDDDDEMTYSDVASLMFDVRTLASKYSAQASGPAKDAVLYDYAFTRALDSAQRLFEKVEDQHERKLTKLENAISDAASEKAKLAAREKVVADALEAQQKELIALSSSKMQLEAQAKAAEQRVSSLFNELSKANRKKEELEQDLEDTKEALEAEQTWQNQLHQRLEEMENKSTHKESKLDELGRLLDEHKSEVSDKATQLEKQKELERSLNQELEAKEKHRIELVAMLEAAKKEHVSLSLQHEELRETHAKEVKNKQDMTNRADNLSIKLKDAEDTIANLQDQLHAAQSEHGATAKELEMKFDGARIEIEKLKEKISSLDADILASKETIKQREVSLEDTKQSLEQTRAELDGTKATHAELLRAHSALGSEHRTYQQKMNQRLTYLKSQLDEHQSTSSSTTTELQRKAMREAELEKRLEAEINLRASLQSDKDAQIFELQKKLAEATTRLRQSEARAAQLKTSLESIQTELNQVSAQRTVLLDEKDKMQALWEKSLTDHFNSLHETQHELETTKGKIKDSDKSSNKRIQELEDKLAEYRQIVERVQTKREGLLRKRTRSRLVKQTWHVKLFKLVGNALLHRDTDNDKQGEKTFTLYSTSVCEALTATDAKEKFVRNSFKVTSGHGGEDELIMAAIDRIDMQEWIDAINDVISDITASDAKKEDAKRRFQLDGGLDDD
uniref:GB1/RHD3-type G domain-containing protein n=1 Tax=Aureoumbra lagunensis TaxID=44058 RepID=A0A6S8AHR4_9STRA|mmetsp:Transcript_22869/g.27496  ORF Transcript_22869/g.27496 Transcript_22869/m.27496 type:complete len:1183 (+) Transcript_22869:55-3603(+)